MINAAGQKVDAYYIERWFFHLKINGASSGGVRFLKIFPSKLLLIRPKNQSVSIFTDESRPFSSSLFKEDDFLSCFSDEPYINDESMQFSRQVNMSNVVSSRFTWSVSSTFMNH